MGKDAEEIFRELKNDLSTYAELKAELVKLNAYERISKVIAVLSYGLLLVALILFTGLFVMLSFGFLLSEWLDSTTAGFAIVAGVYLLLVFAVVRCKERIRRRIVDIVISALNANERR
jgi:hypothetical protein